jgi:isoquinoline 1-oxidoreductase subunit alpha
MITLRVNGQLHHLDIDPETPLLWVLNEHLGLTGAKYSCGIEACGAYTVMIDGQAVLSCCTPAADTLRSAWIAEEVVQCGYCQPAQITIASALLNRNPDPDEDAIDAAMSGVLCRCGTYQGVRSAIHLAAKEFRNAQE